MVGSVAAVALTETASKLHDAVVVCCPHAVLAIALIKTSAKMPAIIRELIVYNCFIKPSYRESEMPRGETGCASGAVDDIFIFVRKDTE
jgi:hypothetical protein